MKNYPCKDCDERMVGCHQSCERYIQVAAANQKEREWLNGKNKPYLTPLVYAQQMTRLKMG